MKFSTRTRYGIRTILEIASEGSGDGVLQKDIAKKQKLSVKYLDHIVKDLKVAGLIRNKKGKKSGYVLTKAIDQITIYEIHNAFEKGICVIDCVSLENNCNKDGRCRAQVFWKGLNDVILDYFQKTTVKDLMDLDFEV